MSNNKEIVINFDKLEKEVQNAVLADEKYSRENQAKFRAIEQHVPTYEDFRQIVLASHLKPLDKGETLRSVSVKNTWNLAATSKTPNENDKTKNSMQETANISQMIPKSNLEFIQLWRKIGDDQVKQWEFIKNIGADKLIELFMVEINGDMLGKFITLLYNQLNKNENDDQFECAYKLTVNLLNGFCKCNRFELNFLFLQKNEIEMCKKLFEKLEEFYKNSKIQIDLDLSSLKKKYFK